MKWFAQVPKLAETIVLLLVTFVFGASAQAPQMKPTRGDSQSASEPASARRTTYLKAFVVDDRLSALRREPSLHSQVVRRLRLGHSIYRIRGRGEEAGRFCRIAVSRRTRGWIYESALAVQGRTGEDQRIMKLIESNADTFDRITLCRILIEHFSGSRLVPRALLLIGEEAERATPALGQRARKRLAEPGGEDSTIGFRDYYLNDSGLDRYSKLGVSFEFSESTVEYVYDGKAYREIVKRFPQCEEAALARHRLELTRQKLARRE